MAAGLPAAVPLDDRSRRLPRRAAPLAALPAVMAATERLVADTLEQKD